MAAPDETLISGMTLDTGADVGVDRVVMGESIRPLMEYDASWL